MAHRAQLHLGLGFGITSWLQVTGELPMVIAQTGDDLTQTAFTSTPDGFGLGSPRLAARLGFLSQGAGGLKADAPLDLALQLGLSLPFGVGNALNIESGWNFVPQLSAGRDLGPVRLGGEVSALIRPATALTANTVRDTVGSAAGPARRWSPAPVTARASRARFIRSSRWRAARLRGSSCWAARACPSARWSCSRWQAPASAASPARRRCGCSPASASSRRPSAASPTPRTRPADCPDLDDDRDGLKNRIDRCPLEPEDKDQFEDDDGCIDPDNDRDRVPDVEDQCPIEPGPSSNNGCPIRIRDNDNDGTPDLQDKCPTVPGPKSHDGCPIKDQDLDGVEDEVDACPTEPGPKERKGCPLKDRTATPSKTRATTAPT